MAVGAACAVFAVSPSSPSGCLSWAGTAQEPAGDGAMQSRARQLWFECSVSNRGAGTQTFLSCHLFNLFLFASLASFALPVL